LKFARTRGAFRRFYSAELGLPDRSQCARDARVMYRLAVADSYCDVGVAADVVFFPTMAQAVPGVSGWGADVAQDQHGRPIILMMGWKVPPTAKGRADAELTGEDRKVVLHELLHGLGFSIQKLKDAGGGVSNVARGALGMKETLGLATLRPVVDLDGTRDDVWHTTGPRTMEVARGFFNCSEAWFDALPMMGLNPLGPGSRGSHFETRLLADELMSYGGGAVVSPFTLSFLEDLGFYLADYSAVRAVLYPIPPELLHTVPS
jgi:hypothetical protein